MTSLLKPKWIETSPAAAFYEDGRRELGLLPLPCAWSCDLANETLIWSRGVFELFGMAPGTRVDRRSVVQMYVGESRALMERLRAQAIANLGSFTMEAQIRRADGELRWMRLTADVVRENGRATKLYGAKQDITTSWTG